MAGLCSLVTWGDVMAEVCTNDELILVSVIISLKNFILFSGLLLTRQFFRRLIETV